MAGHLERILADTRRRVGQLHGARSELGLKPVGEPIVGQFEDLEQPGIGLLAHLHGVSAVDEQGRCFSGNRRQAGRAGESGEPAQSLRARRNVLALVLVGAWHDQAIKLARGHQGPQPLQAAGRRTGLLGSHEGLEHGLL
jgi:hypothetical protein